MVNLNHRTNFGVTQHWHKVRTIETEPRQKEKFMRPSQAKARQAQTLPRGGLKLRQLPRGLNICSFVRDWKLLCWSWCTCESVRRENVCRFAYTVTDAHCIEIRLHRPASLTVRLLRYAAVCVCLESALGRTIVIYSAYTCFTTLSCGVIYM